MNRFGARPLLVGICALAVVRWVLTAFITDPIAFIVLNGMHGVTFGLFFGVLVAVVAARTPPEMRQAMQGTIASAAFGLGGALGSPFCGLVFEHTDAQTTWLALAGVAAVAFVVAWRTIR
jgi:MFS family permease